MQWSVSASTVLHILLVVVAWVGLPHIKRDTTPTETPIMVEIARISDVTNPPPPAPTPPKEEPKKQEEPKPAQPPPPKPAAAPPPPPPPPPQPSEPEPKVAAVPPPPEPKPKPKETPPEPEAKPTPPTPKASPVLDKAKPKRKPQQPDNFASVLKTVDQLKQQPKPEKPDPKAKPKEEPKKDQFENQVAKALQNPSKMNDPTRELSMTVIDAVRQQIQKCWNVPAGAKGARDMTAQIEVTMNQDGTVRRATIQNTLRADDHFYKAFAESALRAVLNPQCQPYKLPPEKYDQWKDIVLVFDPREML